MDEIVRSKFIPPRLRHPLVARTHLNTRLHEGLEKKLVLVAAPAGYGKSTLISSWVTTLSKNVAVAWLTLDADDNDCSHFLSCLVAALAHAVPHLRAPLATALAENRSDGRENGSRAATQLTPILNVLATLKGNLVLVLDDYHAITTPAVHTLSIYLLNHLPETVTVVILTRVDPPLHLARLRAQGQLVSLRAVDLRFSVLEAGEFLNLVMGLCLSPAQVATLTGHTEGWITGLQLAGLSLQQHQDVEGFFAEFAGDDHNIRSYLVDEVLAGQPAEVRQFLLFTSILEQLSAPLCAAVRFGDKERHATEDLFSTQQILEYLEQHNLFIVALDEHHEWYRYHALFAELLRLHLWREHHDDIPGLHRRAARWLRRHGFIAEAHRQMLAAHRRTSGPRVSTSAREENALESKSWLTRIRQLPFKSLRRSKRWSVQVDSAHVFARDEFGSPIAPRASYSASSLQQRAAEHTSSALHEPLSRREEEVLVLLADGLSYQEIAQRLVISLPTVKTHVTHIYDKLDAHNRKQALQRARDLHLLTG